MMVQLVAGRLVRCPVKGTLLPETDTEVPDNPFWHRRLHDGDVVRVPSEDNQSTPEATKAIKLEKSK